MNSMPLWIEVVTAVLLVASGILAVTAALGLVRLKDFFQRMHPPALANTLSAWCVCLGSIVYFSALDGGLTLQAWLVNILLAITAPELLESVGCVQNKYHAYDVWGHALRCLDECPPLPVLRVAGLLHDIGKPRSRAWSDKNQDYTFY